MSSMASSSSRPYYDVFFTFHSKCRTITSLQTSLREARINAYIDDHEEITPALSEAIDGSKLAVIAFTKDFFSSRKCLHKLRKIMMGRIQLMPVLCGMSPRDLTQMGRNEQSESDGCVGGLESCWIERLANEHFSEHFERKISFNSFKTKLQGIHAPWKRRSGESTRRSGWILSTDCSRDDKIIEEITHSIRLRLDTTNLIKIPRHIIGIQLRVNKVLGLCDYHSKDYARNIIVGIWGVGGSGKTTIARYIYDVISGKFERKCFLASIKNVWEKDNGRACLQAQLTSDLSIMERKNIRDTLVVLDDVNQIEQLIELWRNEWCGFGSMLLITTRDKHILDNFGVKYFLEAKPMNQSESLELFSWNAFVQSSLRDSFTNLAKRVVSYCEGLPLVLEVLGALLLRKTTLEWDSVLKRLKSIPTGEIQEKLKISCEYLDDAVKDLFYNIACFYVGDEEQHVVQKLRGFQFPVETGIRMLIEHSLVKVDRNNKLDMHDLLQEIGKEMNPRKPKPGGTYDVFLSFRGDDTRKSFATHLYVALKKAGINVFMDSEIRKGKNNSSSLMQAIESSKMSIIVFSIDYAGSTWCLNELEKIMECHRTTGQGVLPIFFGVRPSDVRKQIGTFGKAFETLISRISESKDKTSSWTRALTEAAFLTRWDSEHYRTDAQLIDNVVEDLIMKLDDDTYLFVAHYQVGVKPRAQEIVELLSEKSNEIMVIGIFGMGGIGKSTIAKAIYNKIGQSFDAKSFIPNIREAWEHENGLVHLQEQLLSDILQRRMPLHNVELGKAIMKKRFCHSRALVILDDVSNVAQLNALFGSHEWFGRGSRIIITTRDKHVLKFLEANHVYSMKEMDDNESLQLFSWHAFKQASPMEDFIELSQKVIAYCEGLPLALEILGSYLFDRPIHAWESVLDRLKGLPNDQIQKKLKISYDGLSDDKEKDIFLDICCFFIGRDRNYTTQILNGCGLHAEIGITRLIELSLVKVDMNNKLHMHGLLRDMGRNIIRESSPDEPEKRTRLWFYDDVVEVLKHNLGTRTVKGLALNLSRGDMLSFDMAAFKKMIRLRLLQLGHVKLDGNFKYLSTELRWLCWQGFPLSYMPGNFYQENIIAIDLKYSHLTHVWEKSQLLERLKILKLSHSYYLRETPNFSKLPNLERLILKDCPCLSSIHQSIGDLKYLILLNLKNCKDLSDLPSSLYNLKSLKTLNLFGCSKIDKLEEGFEQMESLTTLLANETAIVEVPRSLVRSRSIKYVSLCGYEGLPHDLFSRLVWSWTSPTNNRRFLHQAFVSMPFLLQHLFHNLKFNGNLHERRSKLEISSVKSEAADGFHDQIHTIRDENFTNLLSIKVGASNKVIDTLLKNISQLPSIT